MQLSTKGSSRAKGFTLIELLIVISIIGVLSTLLFANFNSARQRGRDAARKSDLREIQTALRLYYNDYGSFPTSSGTYLIQGCGTASPPNASCNWGSAWVGGSATYITTLPEDPLSPDIEYRYTQTSSDTYTLKTCLENKSDDKCGAAESWCTNGCVYTVSP